jgi:hypothetical protein
MHAMRIFPSRIVLLGLLIACAARPPTPVAVPVPAPVLHPVVGVGATAGHVVAAVSAVSTPGECPTSGVTFFPLDGQVRGPSWAHADGAGVCALTRAPGSTTLYFVAELVPDPGAPAMCMCLKNICRPGECRPITTSTVVRLVTARDAADAFRKRAEIIAGGFPADAVEVGP